MLVFRITKKKIDQNFHASKNDIKQRSDVTEHKFQLLQTLLIEQLMTAIENKRFEIMFYLNSNIQNFLFRTEVYLLNTKL